MATKEKSTPGVINPVKMPKLKIDSKKATAVNAFTTAFATFFGCATIFAAISTFTKGKWDFNIPFVGPFLGSNLGQVDNLLVVALLALACALIGLFTVRRITDANYLKICWQKVAKVFAVIAVIFCVNMLAVLLYSLLSLGRKSYDVSQGALWGSSFVANLILAAGASAMCFIGNKIAQGNTKILGVLRFVAVGIASVGLVMAIVSLLVSFYAKGSSTTELEDSLYDLKDLFLQ